LSKSPILLKLSGIWMLVGAIIMLLSPMLLIYERRIDTVVGIILVLIFILVASFEVGAAKVTFRTEVGGWGGVVQALVFAILAKLLILIWAQDWYFYLNIVFAVGEFGILAVVYRRKDLFMPPLEEIETTMKRLSGPKVKVASECPNCHEVVELNWESCPYCGTKLKKLCGNCSQELEEATIICPNCGTPVESVEAITKTIESLRQSLDDVESSEALASQYAKLAENLLKVGDNRGALEAYQEAVKSTEYVRKRSYFMVKMARILKNIGELEEALDILDSAMELDPDDYAGAAEVKKVILSPTKEGESEEGSGALQTS
jgi:tetratricopeptide (TPR) repeat protein